MLVSELPNSITLVNTEDRGRGIAINRNYFNKPVPPGTELFCTLPYEYVLQHIHWNSRCFRCFSESAILKCCGKCNIIRYCSIECQKYDWISHKGECSDIVGFLKACKKNNICSDDITDLVLLGRTLRKFERLNDTSSIPTVWSGELSQNAKNYRNLIHPSATDTKNMCVVDSLLKPSICVDIVSTSGLLTSKNATINRNEIITWLSAFQCNNFAITDDLLVPIGAGVYPAGSLINHNCKPNCILMYDSELHIQVCRSLCSIEPGDELFYSYTDTALPTNERQFILRTTYQFACNCNRCTFGLTKNHIDIDSCLRMDRWGRQIPQLNALVNVHTPTSTCYTNLTFHYPLPTEELFNLCCIAVNNFEKADSKLLDHSLEKKLELQLEGIKLLNKLLHPLNLDLYTKTGEAFTTALSFNNRQVALQLGNHLTTFLKTVYSDTPYHPMLGLHIHTMGDLYSEVSDLESSTINYQHAYDILSIAYGPGHLFVYTLQQHLKTH